MTENTFALKGDILYAGPSRDIIIRPNAILLCENGAVAGIFEKLPARFAAVPLADYSGKLIIPGLVDLHLHAPQYTFRALGMDLELLDWLNTRAFPEEEKYASLAYASVAYEQFVDALKNGATTRASIFATIHVPATLLLMDMLEESGLVTLVGKVNMDANSSPGLQEKSAEDSLENTKAWLAACGKYTRTGPILTPRFIPSCSPALLSMLSDLQERRGLALQSHLSESPGEVAWVHELYPEVETYAEAYLQYGLFGGDVPTIMAHCVYSLGREMDVLAQQGVWVAHCPTSNSNLASGVAPVRAFLNRDMRVGLGSDVAGGHQLSLFGVMAEAIKDSKLRWRLQDSSAAPLTVAEVFYLATRGGGSFFGKVGAFEEGWAFDALVLDDQSLPCPFALSPQERLERLIYLGGDANVAHKYVAGRQVK